LASDKALIPIGTSFAEHLLNMKHIILSFLLGLSTLSMAQQHLAVTDSKISFTIKNAGLPVHGTLGKLESTLTFDASQPEAGHLEAMVKVATLETGIALRDRHLQKPDYFDASKYPAIHLVSKSLKQSGNGYFGQFTLTIKGVAKSVSFPFTYIATKTGNRFEGAFTINRRDFNIGGNSWVLSDVVKVEIIVDVAK
jgi:polyisoprenoid-binding protein YceI